VWKDASTKKKKKTQETTAVFFIYVKKTPEGGIGKTEGTNTYWRKKETTASLEVLQGEW